MDRRPTPAIQILLRVVTPPSMVVFAVQRGRLQLLLPVAAGLDWIEFGFTLTLGPSLADGSFNYRGEFAQGSPFDRFVYLNSGRLAGQPESCWERRAKIKLARVARHLVAEAPGDLNVAIQIEVPGAGCDGGPICASVNPTSRLVRREQT